MRLGDLDTLKEDIVKLCRQINASNGITVPTLAFTRVIDNAPTVELFCAYLSDGEVREPCVESPCKHEKPQGDLIIRSELKKAFDKWWGCDDIPATVVEDIIDNAPKVDLWKMRQEATENALKKAEVLYKRPQGIERDVVGYEGLYSVDIFGTVRNLLSGKVVEHYVNEFGYHNVYLYKDKEKKGKRVNRLVAMAFIPNPLNKPQVNHIDGDKDNNNVWNLEWVTNKENSIHAGKTGLYGNGQVKIVETGQVFPNVSSLARYLNVDRSNIYKCLQGKRNKVRGYHFEKVGTDKKGGAE